MHDTSTRYPDGAAEIAELKAKVQELQKKLAAIDEIIVADEQARGREDVESKRGT